MTTKDIYGKSKGGMVTDTCHGVEIRQLNVKSMKIFLSYGHDLRLYPMSIEPRAELPSDMKENYHFGEI